MEGRRKIMTPRVFLVNALILISVMLSLAAISALASYLKTTGFISEKDEDQSDPFTSAGGEDEQHK